MKFEIRTNEGKNLRNLAFSLDDFVNNVNYNLTHLMKDYFIEMDRNYLDNDVLDIYLKNTIKSISYLTIDQIFEKRYKGELSDNDAYLLENLLNKMMRPHNTMKKVSDKLYPLTDRYSALSEFTKHALDIEDLIYNISDFEGTDEVRVFFESCIVFYERFLEMKTSHMRYEIIDLDRHEVNSFFDATRTIIKASSKMIEKGEIKEKWVDGILNLSNEVSSFFYCKDANKIYSKQKDFITHNLIKKEISIKELEENFQKGKEIFDEIEESKRIFNILGEILEEFKNK